MDGLPDSAPASRVRPYRVEIESVDESGRPERWTVQFRRLTIDDVDLLTAIADDDATDSQRVGSIRALWLRMCVTVWRDPAGEDCEEVPPTAVPWDVVLEVYPLHPGFRPGR